MIKSIILEGPNGAGKSTLGEKLSQLTGMPYVHAGPSPGDSSGAFAACLNQLESLRQFGGVIMDRVTPISRMVYEAERASDEGVWLGLFLAQMQQYATLVYCTGEGHFSNKLYYPPGHFDEITLKREAIRELYRVYFHLIPALHYDWKLESAEELLGRIRNATKKTNGSKLS